MERADSLLEKVSASVDRFIDRNEAFRDACERCFVEADKDDDGMLSLSELSSCLDGIFIDMEDVLQRSSIKFEKPSRQKLKSLIEASDVNGDAQLDGDEFQSFYRQVLKLAAFNSARGFLAKYGAGIAASATSAVALHAGSKKIELPEELKPFVKYATPVLSILAGLLARYTVTVGLKNNAEKKLFRSSAFKKPTSSAPPTSTGLQTH